MRVTVNVRRIAERIVELPDGSTVNDLIKWVHRTYAVRSDAIRIVRPDNTIARDFLVNDECVSAVPLADCPREIHVDVPPVGRVCTLSVDPNSTIEQLKKSIVAATGIPVDKQLVANIEGVELEDVRTVRSYCIGNCDTVTVTKKVEMLKFDVDYDGTLYTLSAIGTETIRHVKAILASKTGAARERIVLKEASSIFTGKEGRAFDDDMFLDACGITNGVTLFATMLTESGVDVSPNQDPPPPLPPPEPERPIRTLKANAQIFIKTLTSDITLDVNLNEPVEVVKWLIFDHAHYPVCEQRLVFAGKQLQDGHTLAYYGIKNNSTLHTVFNLRGHKPVILFYPPAGRTTPIDAAVQVFNSHPADFSFATTTHPPPDDALSSTKRLDWRIRIRHDGEIVPHTPTTGTYTRLILDRYAYIFWEFSGPALPVAPDASFDVPIENVRAFLHRLLDMLGLTVRERDDMLTYWLPHVTDSGVGLHTSIVHPSTLDQFFRLNVTTAELIPTAIRRVFLMFQVLQQEPLSGWLVGDVSIPRSLTGVYPITRDRNALTVVEWGASF